MKPKLRVHNTTQRIYQMLVRCRLLNASCSGHYTVLQRGVVFWSMKTQLKHTTDYCALLIT